MIREDSKRVKFTFKFVLKIKIKIKNKNEVEIIEIIGHKSIINLLY